MNEITSEQLQHIIKNGELPEDMELSAPKSMEENIREQIQATAENLGKMFGIDVEVIEAASLEDMLDKLGPQEDLDAKIKPFTLNEAPRVTTETVEDALDKVAYVVNPSGKTTICEIILVNGFSVIGTSSVVCLENFNEKIGRELVRKKAVEKVYELEAYLLQDELSG